MNLVADLEDILSKEQELLLSGDFDSLAHLLAQKTELVNLLSDKRPAIPVEACENLARQAARNETLLSSARRGLMAAITQLREVAEGTEQTTYSSSGERKRLGRKSASVTQKL